MSAATNVAKNGVGTSTRKTGWIWMLLCCLAPIGIIAILAATGERSGGILYLLALLICPIGMLVMMFMGRGSHCTPSEKDERKPH